MVKDGLNAVGIVLSDDFEGKLLIQKTGSVNVGFDVC